MLKKENGVANSTKGEMKTALVMLLCFEYACGSSTNVVGALSVAMGMSNKGENSENNICQTQEQDDPHIVYKL